jgi:hypothetical protein
MGTESTVTYTLGTSPASSRPTAVSKSARTSIAGALSEWAVHVHQIMHNFDDNINIRIPEDAILYSHRRENLKSYIALTGCAL